MVVLLVVEMREVFDPVRVVGVLGRDGVPVAEMSVVGIEVVKWTVDVGGINGVVVLGGTTMMPPDVGRINVAMIAVCVGRIAPGWFAHI